MTPANDFKFCYTSDKIPKSEMFTGWQTCKRTCEARCSRHIGFTFSRSQDLSYGRRMTKFLFSTDHKERRFLGERHHGICLMIFGVASLFCFDCFSCVFPNGRLFYSFQVCVTNIGKFLIARHYSAPKTSCDPLDCLFFWLFCSRDIFAPLNVPLGCSLLSTPLWNRPDWNLHVLK